jgi:hypothetical protein
VLDDHQMTGRTTPWRWPALGLAVLSLVFWAASYSWLLGLTPPTSWLGAASPWLVMEVAAVVTGAPALVAGVLLARRAQTRRVGLVAAWLGGFALIATMASLLA